MHGMSSSSSLQRCSLSCKPIALLLHRPSIVIPLTGQLASLLNFAWNTLHQRHLPTPIQGTERWISLDLLEKTVEIMPQLLRVRDGMLDVSRFDSRQIVK